MVLSMSAWLVKNSHYCCFNDCHCSMHCCGHGHEDQYQCWCWKIEGSSSLFVHATCLILSLTTETAAMVVIPIYQHTEATCKFQSTDCS